jgi:sulfur-oxidizing protein SoxY
MSARRQLLHFGASLGLLSVLPPARGQTHPAAQSLRIDIATLIDNGNAIPITVSVDSPMTEQDYIASIEVTSERNPLPEVFKAYFTPASGKAQVSTRIRLATSQRVSAVAITNTGQHLRAHIDVIVTLAACIED